MAISTNMYARTVPAEVAGYTPAIGGWTLVSEQPSLIGLQAVWQFVANRGLQAKLSVTVTAM